MTQDTMMIIRMITPAAAPPTMAAKLLSADPGGGVVLGEGFELLVVLEVVVICWVQSTPVYPSLQMHSPGCVHLPLVEAMKRDQDKTICVLQQIT